MFSRLLKLKRYRKAIPAILLAMSGTYILSRAGILHGLERLVLDAEAAANPKLSTDVAVVNITNSDYDKLFDGRSPLYPEKLHDIISAIAVSQPAVIAVDIDTSHPQFQGLNVEKTWPPVVWERDISTHDSGTQGGIEPTDVLGAQSPRFNESSGMPALLDDPEDKVTRLYTRCVETKGGPGRSFAYAAVAAYQGVPNSATCENGIKAPMQPLFIRYSLRPGSTVYEKDAAQVLGLSGKQENGQAIHNIPQFKGKIVLLGGTYLDCDRHFTPIGSLPGVMVLANAIQTEINGGGVAARPRWFLFGIEFAASTLLVLLFHWLSLSPAKAFAWGLAATAVISLAASLWSFHTPSRFVNFAPTLLAVLIFETYEHVRQESILSWKKAHAANQDAELSSNS